MKEYVVGRYKDSGNVVAARLIKNSDATIPHEYSYEFYEENDTDGRTFSFNSNTYSETLMEELVKFFAPIVNNISYLNTFMFSKTFNKTRNEHSDEFNNFVEKHKDDEYTPALLAEFLMLKQNHKIHPNDYAEGIKNFEKEFSNGYKSFDEEDDIFSIIAMLYPQYLYVGSKELTFIQSMLDDGNDYSMYNKDDLLNIYKMYSMYHNHMILDYNKKLCDETIREPAGTLHLNHTLREESNYNSYLNNTKIPLTDEFINYVNNITLRELKLIYPCITTDDKDPIKKSVKILSHHKYSTIKDIARINMLLVNKMQVINSIYDVNRLYIDFYENLINLSDKPSYEAFVSLCCDYIADKDKLTDVNVRSIVDFMKIIKDNEYIVQLFATTYNIQYLTAHIGVVKTVEVLIEFFNQDEDKILVEKWNNYLDNIDVYSKLPVSWWLELL